MAGTTDTQSLRFGEVTDVIDFTMIKNLADDIAVQLDAADVVRTAALKRPQGYVSRGGALALPANTTTIATWTAEVIDTNAMIDLVGQPQRITVGALAGTGLYMMEANFNADTTGWTRADAVLLKNGALVAQHTFHSPQSFSVLYASMIVHAPNTTDFFTLGMYHEGGGTTNSSTIEMRVSKLTEN